MIMPFSLEKLFVDVFAPQIGEKVTIMVDQPNGEIHDSLEWQERRQMAAEWHQEMVQFSNKYSIKVNPIVSYDATGVHNGILPEYGECGGNRVRLDDIARESTIIISMPQFSASAPLIAFTKKYENVRVASLPTVTKAMQEEGLSADYNLVAETCAQLAILFDQSDGIEVVFSTGHTCNFDKSDHKPAIQDNGRLHPGADKDAFRFRNLPSGEVCIAPNESPTSRTRGEIPVNYSGELVVFVVQNNQIIDVRGDGPLSAQKREMFRNEKALRNIAEVAIGCNNKAVVTGNILQDEKAGFHWAYGRSDHLGGTVGPQDFSSPNQVTHQDIVYAKGNPVVCQQLDFVFPDGTKKTTMRDGVLIKLTQAGK
jgi:hypothetical protein